MDRILRVGTGYWASSCLLSAIELGVFTALGRRSVDHASLVEVLGLHERGARDFLDALVALGFLTREGDRYANTRESRMFLDRTKPLYVGDSLAMAGSRLWGAWGRLTDALRTGKAQYAGASDGADLFGDIYADRASRERFLASMAGASLGTALALARRFPWNDHNVIADIGTALGVVPVEIVKAHPHLHAIGFDLPAVRESFESFVAEQDLTERVEFRGGDFFVDPLPEADAIIMGHVLHDWGLDQKRALIRKAFDALAPGRVLLIYEALIDDDRCQSEFALLMSLNMLVDTPGGFNFTASDCARWLEEAGFRSWRVEPLVAPDSLIVAVK